MKTLVHFIFAGSLFFNSLIFIPQAVRIFKLKSSKSLSFYTFVGFNIMQFFAIAHGYYQSDFILMFGFMLSFITCGVVTTLIFKYQKTEGKNENRRSRQHRV